MTISVGVPVPPGSGAGRRRKGGAATVTAGRASAAAIDHAVDVLDDLGAALEETSEWLGAPLATYVSGAGTVTELTGWIDGPTAASKEALLRLQTAVDVVD